MREIGGYFELELNAGKHYHESSCHLNYGRNALQFIINYIGFKKVYLPYFTCDAILQPLIQLNIKHEFYSIDENLEPIFDFKTVKEDEAFIYNNYFAFKQNFINTLNKKVLNLIVDNAQDFFYQPSYDIISFNSVRKFFGTPDGAYVNINNKSSVDLSKQSVTNLIQHLLLRVEQNGKSGYKEFQRNEKSINNQNLALMSNITEKLLKNINYENVKNIRNSNFDYLHNFLSKYNALPITKPDEAIAFTYPFLIDNGNLIRKKLVNQRIYTATYWPNVLDWTEPTSIEYYYSKNIVHLPIDQRYSFKDMDIIIKNLKKWIL